ncbi:MAG: hypothetical protein ACQKBW_11920 [Puniceicoccales bacterium]
MELPIIDNGQNDLPEELYTNALKAEGCNPDADGLLDILRKMHMDALSPSMVDRAYSSWKKARRKTEAAKGKDQS